MVKSGHKMSLVSKTGQPVTVKFAVNPRARRLILRLDTEKREAIAVAPSARKLEDAARFASEKVDWIADQLAALPSVQALQPQSHIQLRGEPCQLTLEGEGRRATLLDGPPLQLSLPGDEAGFSRRAERALRAFAKADLTIAVDKYCSQLGVAARKVTIKDTKSRWGSCTSDGRLAFSWRLIMAPREVLDYVAAHECAHLLEMNHSPAFWSHVATCRPHWKKERAWLRQNGRDLHAVKT